MTRPDTAMRRSLFLMFVALTACAGTSSGGDDTGGDDMAGDDGGDGDGDGDGSGGDGGGDTEPDGGGDGPASSVTCTANVPGDYANLQTAFDAFAHAGQDATICIGEGLFMPPNNGAYFSILDPERHEKTLRVVGTSRTSSRIGRTLWVRPGWERVILENLSVDTASNNDPTSIHVIGSENVELRDATLSTALRISSSSDDIHLTVDRCDIGKDTNSIAFDVVANQKSLVVRLTNSILRGQLVANNYTDSDSIYDSELFLDVIHNTFIGPSHILLQQEIEATIANSIFTGATTFSMNWDAEVMMTAHNNAMWGNTANFAGLAVEGQSFVKADCLLDMSGAVPVLGAGSPCINAGDPTHATEHDYANRLRGALPDIGAVEM